MFHHSEYPSLEILFAESFHTAPTQTLFPLEFLIFLNSYFTIIYH